MATIFSAWNSHDWSNRLLDLKPGVPVVQHYCGLCARNFVNEKLTDERYAVRAGIHALARLSDGVSQRWLTEPCPGKGPESDDADLKIRFV
jgi:hypothetical protein